MKTFVLYASCWAGLVLHTVTAAAQTLTRVQFPATDATAITDCSTPTVLTLSDGTTATFRGGQFIHYEDENFSGTMYATNSAAACQRTGPDVDLLKRPVTEVSITFSKPISKFQLRAYNLNGPRGSFDGTNPGMGISVWDASGYSPAGYGLAFPPLLMAPDAFFYPWSTEPPITVITFETWTAKQQPDYTYTPNDWFWGLTSLSVPQGPGDFVKFDFSQADSADDGKILLSKAPWDIGYPSKYQMPASGGSAQVKVSGTLISGVTKQPKAGRVYLRVDDLPDTAPYRGGDAAKGDNDGPPATLGGSSSATLPLDTDAQGRFQTTLSIASHTAGDNYQIAGSTNEKFECGAAGCQKSGVFTLWKRVYVEEEHMFRGGSFITERAAASATEVKIADPTPFQGLTPGAVLELVHAARGNGEWYYSDQVLFKALKQSAEGQWSIELDPSTPLSRDYGSTDPTRNRFTEVGRDGVGIVASGTYDPNPAYVSGLFGSMFVEVLPDSPTVSHTPYVESLKEEQRAFYVARWLQDGTALGDVMRLTNPNVIHRMGVAQSPPMKKTGGLAVELGATAANGGSNFSVIYVDRIEEVAAGSALTAGLGYQGLDPTIINGEVTAHETVHIWVHSGGADGTGHCERTAYSSGLNCLMHTPYKGPGLADGVVDLHYEQHGADSEYMQIRRATDPLPQN